MQNTQHSCDERVCKRGELQGIFMVFAEFAWNLTSKVFASFFKSISGLKWRYYTLRKNLNSRKYEYLYYQFYNGNPEPDMPRSFSKSFSDLPMEVLDEIVSNLSAKERLGVRKVCRNLRDVIDQQKPNFKILKIHFEKNQSIILKIDDLDLKFPKDSYEEPWKRLENSLKSSRHVEGLEMKLDDSQGSKSLLSMLRNVSMTRLKFGKAEISAISQCSSSREPSKLSSYVGREWSIIMVKTPLINILLFQFYMKLE
ncbi:hypothetical protein B9Z55_026893 [Caenorhabditis nigoni]|uniref:F-box domain-containing protein n=1 Tax=Caenorhabditis nigoni TaxID=1611254 RepID=A0A2G5SIA9_9PELO|nr:hypothetical protein B9Z55_026893 [Caenorhabditis nigoni]